MRTFPPRRAEWRFDRRGHRRLACYRWNLGVPDWLFRHAGVWNRLRVYRQVASREVHSREYDDCVAGKRGTRGRRGGVAPGEGKRGTPQPVMWIIRPV